MNINCSIPGLKAKAVQTKEERKWYTNVHLNENFPKESWIRIYTDGSAEDASKNGGAGIYIQYTDGKEEQISLSTGSLSTNYKAESEALSHAAKTIANKLENKNNIVFLSDALSVLLCKQELCLTSNNKITN